MANVVRDPREHPEAIIPDLTKPNPLVNFSKADIAFVYGSKWKQRYFKKIGHDTGQTHRTGRTPPLSKRTPITSPIAPAANVSLATCRQSNRRLGT